MLESQIQKKIIAEYEEVVDLNINIRSLIGWEEKKQAQKEAYWAEQKQKKGYFNR